MEQWEPGRRGGGGEERYHNGLWTEREELFAVHQDMDGERARSTPPRCPGTGHALHREDRGSCVPVSACPKEELAPPFHLRGLQEGYPLQHKYAGAT